MGEEVTTFEFIILAGLALYALWRIRHVIERMSR